MDYKENVNITKGEQIYEKFHKWRIREKTHKGLFG